MLWDDLAKEIHSGRSLLTQSCWTGGRCLFHQCATSWSLQPYPIVYGSWFSLPLLSHQHLLWQRGQILTIKNSWGATQTWLQSQALTHMWLLEAVLPNATRQAVLKPWESFSPCKLCHLKMTFLIKSHCPDDCLHHLGLSRSVLHGGHLSGTKAASSLQISVSWNRTARVSVLISLWLTVLPRWITNACKASWKLKDLYQRTWKISRSQGRLGMESWKACASMYKCQGLGEGRGSIQESSSEKETLAWGGRLMRAVRRCCTNSRTWLSSYMALNIRGDCGWRLVRTLASWGELRPERVHNHQLWRSCIVPLPLSAGRERSGLWVSCASDSLVWGVTQSIFGTGNRSHPSHCFSRRSFIPARF